MLKNSRTVWTEGMFLGPQHFQQHDRFLLNCIAAVNQATGPYAFGLSTCELDQHALAEGKFALISLSGLFPDGTPFTLPDDDELPEPLEIDGDVRDRRVSLALPFSLHTEKDFAESRSRESFSRYLLSHQSVKDRHSLDSESEETVFTGGLWTRLILEDDDQTAFHTIPLARIAERRDDGSVLLDSSYYCCAMSLRASTPLLAICRELQGLLTQRAQDLAGRLGQPDASDTAQLTLLLLLQIINRARPLLTHFNTSAHVHPEVLYRELIQLAGELSTLASSQRLCPEFPEYLHRDQYASFAPLVANLRESLNWIPDTKVESIPVKHVKDGKYIATVRDLDLFQTARFILAVKARVTSDELLRRFPRQTTISSKAKLRDLVGAHSQGIELKSLANVPNSIPMYENQIYFEMRQDDPLWQEVALSGDIAMHIAGSYSDLQMQLWIVAR